MTLKQIEERLQIHYPNSQIRVIDLTGTGDHYAVHIQSDRFAGLNRVEQHQQVMSFFQDVLQTGELHAFSLRTETLTKSALKQ